MVLIFLIFLTYFFYLYQVKFVFSHESSSEKRVVFSAVAAIPYGKLIFVPFFSLLPNIKLSFLLFVFSVIFYFRYKIYNNFLFFYFFIFLFFGSFYYDYPLSQDVVGFDGFNVILRVFVFLFLFLFSYFLIKKSSFDDLMLMIKIYFFGTFYAVIVGFFIFYFFYAGIISEDDIKVLTVADDLHLIDSFFRFNPGANVNEFSQILAYALLMSFVLPYRSNLVYYVFYVALFLTLTRFTWIAYFISVLFVSPLRLFFLAFISFVFLFFGYYFLDDNLRFIIDSRFAMDIGSSGEERLEKFEYVFDMIFGDFFRFLFGYGFSTNMYVHNVYLQIIYEIGVFGLLFFSFFMYFFFFRYVNNKFSFSIMVFVLVESLAHHILFLTETWFALAIMVLLSKYKDEVYRSIN